MNTAALMMLTDGELAHRVRDAFRDRKLLAGFDLSITAAQGRVTLRGKVRSYYSRQLLVHSCLRVPGVRGVVDEIRVET